VPQQEYANVRVRCKRCGHEMTWCVNVDRNVPEPLRCQPGGGGGGRPSGIRCGECSAPSFRSVDDLRSAVAAALRRGWGPHVKAGAVEVECSA
jgi:hypothetical protein